MLSICRRTRENTARDAKTQTSNQIMAYNPDYVPSKKGGVKPGDNQTTQIPEVTGSQCLQKKGTHDKEHGEPRGKNTSRADSARTDKLNELGRGESDA
ncbi:hypothetical protein ACEPAF_2274 [Sanghuangporus sanghuang]